MLVHHQTEMDMTHFTKTSTGPAHYVIIGKDADGLPTTEYGEGLETVGVIAEVFLDKVSDGWVEVFVYRADRHEGDDALTLTEVTPDIANHAFSMWLDQFGWDTENPPVPAWLDAQLERLCINADHEMSAFRMGERRAA